MLTHVRANEQEVIRSLASLIEKCAAEALAERGVFRVGLSGGSMVNYFTEAVSHITSDFTKWKFFFCDERYVQPDDADSTFGAYKKTLLARTSFTEQQFVCIDTLMALDECARDYEAKVRQEFGDTAGEIPSFDVLLLGMGPDGHTCSLFPGHPLLKESSRLIAPIDDSPKPPPKRVTMTYPLINRSKCCIYAMCGEGKADMVKRVFVDKEPLPAGLVRPSKDLVAFFDEAAGKFVVKK